MKNFKTYQLAVSFYRHTQALKTVGHLKEQLGRAASSIVLNLAEGSGRQSQKDQARFFQIAFGSLRECQAILELAELQANPAWALLDSLAAHLYRLIQNAAG